MLVWRWRKDGRDSGGFKMRAAAAVQVERPSGRCGCLQLGEKPESANIPRHMHGTVQTMPNKRRNSVACAPKPTRKAIVRSTGMPKA